MYMGEAFVMFATQAIMILILAPVTNVPLLKWRARKLKGLNINFGDAYIVSIKALFAAVIVRDVIVIIVVSEFPPMSENFVKIMEIIILVASGMAWWVVHSKSLHKIEVENGLLALDVSRTITSSVLGCLIVGLFSLGILIAIIIALTTIF